MRSPCNSSALELDACAFTSVIGYTSVKRITKNDIPLLDRVIKLFQAAVHGYKLL